MTLPAVPTKITVIVDSREKRPVLFPSTIEWRPDKAPKGHTISVSTKKDALFAGDYCLEFPKNVRHDRACTIERKGSPSELHKNFLTDDWARCSRAYERLSRIAPHPDSGQHGAHYLLIEPSPRELEQYEREQSLPTGLLFDLVVQVSVRFNLHLWIAPHYQLPRPRRRLGEAMIRVMLGHIFHAPLPLLPYSTEWYEKHRYAGRTWKGKGKK